MENKEHNLQDKRCECCGYMTYHREHMGCIRAAEQAQQAVQLTRDWPKIDAAMRDYVESYEMIGDNNEVCYSPTKAEQELIIDCVRGLLAESDFINLLTAQPPAVAVPDEMDSVHDTPFMSADTEPEIAYRDGWNACRDAMLAAMEQPK